jgi:hypothetical protein
VGPRAGDEYARRTRSRRLVRGGNARNPNEPTAVSAAMTTESTPLRSARASRVAAPAILLAVVAACSPAVPSGTPIPPGATAGPTANASPTAMAGIQHPTGATDVVLRLESGGGLMMMGAESTNTPLFTLYGDGRVVWRDLNVPMPAPMGSVAPFAGLRTVRLTEAAVQTLLEDAIGRGGLSEAAETYMGQGADFPTATFTLNVNGTSKSVSVTPLSPDMHPNAAPIVAVLAGLADRLQGFGAIAGTSDLYVPTGYRGILMPQDQPLSQPVDWPWTTVAAADFKAAGNEFVRLHTLTPDDVAKLGLTGVEGGFTGLTLQDAGKFFGLSLRPLMPEETE